MTIILIDSLHLFKKQLRLFNSLFGQAQRFVIKPGPESVLSAQVQAERHKFVSQCLYLIWVVGPQILKRD